jgi:hypothetical protein
LEQTIEDLIIKRADADAKKKSANELEDEKLYEVHHSYINF